MPTTKIRPSFITSGSFTGSLLGTASYAQTASFASNVSALSSNTTVNLDSSMTTAQMQALIDAQPKNLNGYSLTFQFADGTYTLTGVLSFSYFYGGFLNIRGNPANETASATKNVVLKGASGNAAMEVFLPSCRVDVRFIQFDVFNAASSFGISLTGAISAGVVYCGFTNQSASTTNGVSVKCSNQSGVSVILCGFNRNNISIEATDGSRVSSRTNSTVVNPSIGIASSSSTINSDGTVTGTTARAVSTGGIISANAGNLL